MTDNYRVSEIIYLIEKIVIIVKSKDIISLFDQHKTVRFIFVNEL